MKGSEPRNLTGSQADSRRKPWKPPTLKLHGKLADIIRGGGGKLSPSVDGDGRKPNLMQ
ncbi:MAG: hypothetical protein GY769_22780 [bacterium]|nr:hypothetical protein [bacterium]